MSYFAAVLAVALATLLMSSRAVVVPGYRATGCSFGYNNVYYIIGGKFTNGTNFVSAPLPLTQLDSGLITWTELPDPPQWQNMTAVGSTPQFHCAVNYDGKMFLFGNAVGFAVFDIPTNTWSTTPPTFASSSISMTNLLNQQGLNAAVGPDGYTISILATSPPTYMEFNSRTMTMNGVALVGFVPNLIGFCMDVVATTPPTPVACGGWFGNSYSSSCWQLGLESSFSKPITNLLQAQGGCTLMAYNTHFTVWPGYLSYYAPGAVSTAPNPDMASFEMGTMSWTPVPNQQGQNYLPMYSFMAAITMPGTATSVFYGGYNPVSLGTGLRLYYFNLQSNSWVSRVSPATNPFPKPISPSSPPGPSSSPDSSHSNVGAIAGGAAGGVVVIGALIAFLFYNRRKTLQRQGTQHADQQQNEVQSSPYQYQYQQQSNVIPESKYKVHQDDGSKGIVEITPRAENMSPRHPQITVVDPQFGSSAVPRNPQLSP